MEQCSFGDFVWVAFVVAAVFGLMGYLVATLMYSRKGARTLIQLSAAQANESALKQHSDELRVRLNDAESLLRTAQHDVGVVKDRLAEEGKRAEGLDSHVKALYVNQEGLRESVSEKEKQRAVLQEKYEALNEEFIVLKTSFERREVHFQEQLTQLAETKKAFTREFENLANTLLEEKRKALIQTSEQGIVTVLKPFQDQIERFQKRVNEVHDAALQGNSALSAEIRKVVEIGLSMGKEASNLATALKGDSQQRGAWGEAQLKRTLEMSGLMDAVHYEAQSAFKDDEGKNKQTDYVIKLPEGKHMIIDSKVSLVAYDRAVSAATPEEHRAAMQEHIKAVRRHIDDLSSKKYTNLVGMNSPSFVLMFMPIEPAYIEALRTDKNIFEYGYNKGVVLVSHTTLVPILRTVSNVWMIEQSNVEARHISEKAGEIYNQVCAVAERLSKLGVTLNTVSNHYNSTVKALAGQQGLYGKVDRFNQLSVKISKTLPNVEPMHLDFDVERLSLMVTPSE